jgi:hypothetical protein
MGTPTSFPTSGTGLLTFFGTGTATFAFIPSGSGAFAFAGTATAATYPPVGGRSTITFAGTAAAAASNALSGQGAITFAGRATLTWAIKVFYPPVTDTYPPIYLVQPDAYRPVPDTSQRLFSHYKPRPASRNVYWLVDGTFTTTQPWETEPGTVIKRTYFGAHYNPVTPAEEQALRDSGFGFYIITVPGV